MLLLSLLVTIQAGVMAAPITASSLPEPVEPEHWISHNDYPSSARGGERVGTTWFEVTADKSGKPIGCRTILSSGTLELDRQSCVSTMVRGKFRPARDRAGQPLHGTLRRRTMWNFPPRQAKPVEMPADATLKLNALPSRARPSSTLRLIETANGAVESCEVQESSLSATLDQLACSTALAAKFPNQATDAEGRPVRAVRLRKIEFIVGTLDHPTACVR